MAGNPNPKGSKPDKLMRDAIMVALKREAVGADGKPTNKLTMIAEALVEQAVDGDLVAIKEINDRVDGKALQTIGGDSTVTVSYEGAAQQFDAKLDRVLERARSKRAQDTAH